ncbi:DUF3429 domain-containing protein [Palleronia sp. KMU-117]|uniref:DUF3429 domain-containing protein n=1 Tax=Palleronia sp. KMU-117 TaxID=3434108 RepID=UPI003D74C8F8
MTPIPRSALVLGLAGLLPFLWGALTLFSEAAAGAGMQAFGPRFVGPYVLLSYGTVILSFMSGVLWGFATRAEGRVASTGYALSVLPALWAFFFVGGGPVSAAIYLIAGFVGLLGLDWLFWTQGLAPRWWMSLRIGLTVVVVACLSMVVI